MARFTQRQAGRAIGGWRRAVVAQRNGRGDEDDVDSAKQHGNYERETNASGVKQRTRHGGHREESAAKNGERACGESSERRNEETIEREENRKYS